MDLDRSRESTNVEDRRGMRPGRAAGGIGIGTIILALIAMYFGVDPSFLLQGGSPAPQTQSVPAQAPGKAASNDEMGRFIRRVLGDTEQVLYSGVTPTACGTGHAASGPFYCPADGKVYLDTSFFEEMRSRLKAGGDFAYAYVIAHEVGHHVQNVLGISGKVDSMRSRISEKEFNQLSVRLELQADCFAGVWAHHGQKQRQILQPGDIEEALAAANAIGDDRLQKASRGYAVPDSFTHGTSAQRMRWFKTGFEQGNIKACDTFTARSL
jgi:uncharacterized protein